MNAQILADYCEARHPNNAAKQAELSARIIAGKTKVTQGSMVRYLDYANL
jgi:hypothetical protein